VRQRLGPKQVSGRQATSGSADADAVLSPLMAPSSLGRGPDRGVYCTVVAQNYLSQALALYSSIQSTEPDRQAVILVLDADRSDLAATRPNLKCVGTEVLSLTPRAVHELAAIYDVVEFATAIKPLFVKALLSEFEYVVYLDPDTYLVSPLLELPQLMKNEGIVLTPHFLEAIPPGESYITEVHSLALGIHNLGFCAFSHAAMPFLNWWWSHLERECLVYPLLGLFVDQKWTDVGAVLFNAHSIKHYGYNVGPWNLQERAFARRDGRLVMERTGEELRFFHFSGFTPSDPDAISERLNVALEQTGVKSTSVAILSRQYADELQKAAAELGEVGGYRFDRDTEGRRLTKRTRRAYRRELLRNPRGTMPSPFLPEDAPAFRQWRIRSLGSQAFALIADLSIALKYVFPDQYEHFRRSAKGPFRRLRVMLLDASRMRR